MRQQNFLKSLGLPQKIQVKINLTKENTFFAELPAYDVFTEAATPVELFFNVNDLIYTVFDVPKKYQGKVIYTPPVRKPRVSSPKNVLFRPSVRANTTLDRLCSL